MTRSWLIILGICACLLLLYTSIYRKTSFSDTVLYSGDKICYQSMAINWIKGHGLKRAAFEPVDTYKFNHTPGRNVSVDKSYERFVSRGKQNPSQISIHTYRTPGYPVFLGLVYKVFGIHPQRAKQVQLGLLISVGSFLPVLGYAFWGWTGVLSAGIAGFLFVSKYHYELAEPIMTEGLITLLVFVTCCVYVNWEKRKSVVSALLLGAVLGVALLVKSSLIFVPLILLYIIYRRCLNWKVKARPHIAAAFIGMVILVLPYSMYASIKSGRLVFLSTNGSAVLLRGNNEYCANGGHHSEWEKNPAAFYQKQDIAKLSTMRKVAHFLISYRHMVPRMFINKINLAFASFPYFSICLGCLIHNCLRTVIRDMRTRRKIRLLRAKVVNWWSDAALLLIVVVHFPGLGNSALSSALSPVVLLACLSVIMLFALLAGSPISLYIPAVVLAFWLNHLGITIIFCGEPRWTKPLDFLFMISALYYFLHLGMQFLYSRLRPSKLSPSFKRQ